MKFPTKDAVWGVMAEFEGPSELLAASEAAYAKGYRRMDAHSPYPIEEVSHALGHHKSYLPWIVLIGGIVGAFAGWSLQYWSSTIAYPMNVGGRPLNSWPAFIVVIFECTILFAAFSAVLGMLALNRLPRPYHPVFNVDRFAESSTDSYFLVIRATDSRFQRDEVTEFLRAQGPSEVWDIHD